MQGSRKYVLVATAFVMLMIACATALYFGFRRGVIADASPAPELLAQVPAGAPMLIYADLAAIRASAFYQQRPNRGAITVPDHDYTDFVQATGFDFEKDLDRVVIAAWPAAMQEPSKQDQKKMIVLADGRFDRQKIREYALRKGKLDHQFGREVFLFPTDAQSGWNSITLLDEHRVAIVQGPSIAPLMTRQDDATAVDPARERAARVAGAAFFAITQVPPIPDNFAPGGVQSAQMLSMAKSLRWLTLAARPEGNNLRVSLDGECQSASDARQLQAALELLRMFGRAGLENPKTRGSMDPIAYGVAEAVLKNADVSASAEQVRIMVELTPDILKLGQGATTH